MPNWCANTLKITHDDTAQIARAVAAFARGEFMQEFDPCPQDLLDTMAGHHAAGSPEEAELQARRASNLEKYGAEDWYDWKIANWGTKWDVGGEECDSPEYTDGDTEATFHFDSAWSPPTEFFATLEDQGFEVDAMWYEPGVGFCGQYSDGAEDSYNIEGDSDWVDENIPDSINTHFAIAENMAMWEDEEQAEDSEEEDGE